MFLQLLLKDNFNKKKSFKKTICKFIKEKRKRGMTYLEFLKKKITLLDKPIKIGEKNSKKNIKKSLAHYMLKKNLKKGIYKARKINYKLQLLHAKKYRLNKPFGFNFNNRFLKKIKRKKNLLKKKLIKAKKIIKKNKKLHPLGLLNNSKIIRKNNNPLGLNVTSYKSKILNTHNSNVQKKRFKFKLFNYKFKLRQKLNFHQAAQF